jgi:hypothetical protein
MAETHLVYGVSVKPSGEKEPFSIKPRSALPKYEDKKAITINLNSDYGTRTVTIPYDKLLVKLDLKFDNSTQEPRKITDIDIYPDPAFISLYRSLAPSTSQKVAFIYPTFTQAAYSKNGFYDYYLKRCDSRCLTVQIPTVLTGGAYSSGGGASMLYFLNYADLTDIDVDKNPSILKKYDKVILLHNEYVTKREFDAITNHKNVVYLYPNALYAEIKADYDKNTITLVRGHGYPSKDITNGFGWRYDNSKYEYDLQCDNWKFTTIPNGKMLNCNPDYRVFFDKGLLLEIKK